MTVDLSVNEALAKGIAAHRRRNLDVAFKFYKAIIEELPGHPDASHNMGLLAVDLGKGEAGLPLIHDAINTNPRCEQYWLSLLYVQKKLGRAKDLQYTAARILMLFPRSDNLLEVIRRDVRNLNTVERGLIENGKWIKTAVALLKERAFDRLLSFMVDVIYTFPRDPEAWYYMGLSCRASGDRLSAIINFMYCLEIDPTSNAAYRQLGHELGNVVFNKPLFGLLDHVSNLLREKTLVRPNSIARSTLSLLKFEQSFKSLVDLGKRSYNRAAAIQCARDIGDAALFFRFLELCPLPDVEIELALKLVRRAFLESLNLKSLSDELSTFIRALAHQCFLNDYVYTVAEEELTLITDLKARIEGLLRGNLQPSNLEILCLACYVKLSELKWHKRLKSGKLISSVINVQVVEPEIERSIRAKIFSVFKTDNAISESVRTQYEYFPYPRWVYLGLDINPKDLSEVIINHELDLKKKDIVNISAPKILIAGCGTGQHPIATAKRFKNSSVTAIDLSLTSIAYAKRKTEEHKIRNVDYIHCDILQLYKLQKKFDLIESVGVLHHMEDPIEGWRALYNCLQSGGLMKIGLYSEHARQHIVKVREEIKKAQIGKTIDQRRDFRASLLKSSAPHHKQVSSSLDFYSLSEVTDLLFHVQEHRFTIPQIKGMLDTLNLKFCGFDDFSLKQRFKKYYPNASDLFNLEKWHEFESNNPELFLRMYQFWCQKID